MTSDSGIEMCIRDSRSDYEEIKKIIKEMLGKSKDAFINPPFYCDYGFNIETGKNFFANYNCTIIDVAKVTIGDNCQLAPNVAIYTAGHPVHPVSRNSKYEYGIEAVSYTHLIKLTIIFSFSMHLL